MTSYVPTYPTRALCRLVTPPLLALMVSACDGCRSTAANPTPMKTTHATATYPARPIVLAPPFKVFHKTPDTMTLVTKETATDDEVSAILWELHDAAHTHSFDKLGISQKAVDDRKPIIWFHLYRGTKCAAEKYASGAPPCGGSYHAAGDYTFGDYTNPAWDSATLRSTNDKEVPLWDTESHKP